jgi:hypothetical protein
MEDIRLKIRFLVRFPISLDKLPCTQILEKEMLLGFISFNPPYQGRAVLFSKAKKKGEVLSLFFHIMLRLIEKLKKGTKMD